MVTAPTTALDSTDEHSTTALYRAAIGDISKRYYLPRFTRFEAAERPGLSWNWAAALNTLNWLIFRQLWHAALLYSGSMVALALLLLGIGNIVFQLSEGTQWGLLAALVGLAFAVPGLGGNALLFKATRQRVQNALAKNQTLPDACAQLSKQASTRKRLIILAGCNLAVAAIAAQSYAMFAGFEPLPAGTPVAISAAPEGRNVASGRAVDSSEQDNAKAPTPAPAASSAAPTPTPTSASTSTSTATATPSPTGAALAPPAASASATTTPPTATAAASSASAIAPKEPTPQSAVSPSPATPTAARTQAAVSSAAGTRPAASVSAPTTASAPAPAAKPAASGPALAASQPTTGVGAVPAKPTATPSITPTRAAASAPPPPASAAAKPKFEKSAVPSAPVPVALRSAAAASAAREVAAARQSAASEAIAPPRPSTQAASQAVAAPPTLTGSRFVVNVGLFADANNARNALVKLMDAELPVVSKDIRFPKGNRTRLQVGPFDTLAEADSAADKVRALELEARVAPLP